MKEPERTPRQLLTMAEVSAMTGFSIDTLRYWRHKGSGPRSFKAGRRVMYHRDDVVAYFDALRVGGGAA